MKQKRFLVAIMSVVILRGLFLPAFAAGPTELTFGIYPYDTPSQIYQNFEPLMQQLSKRSIKYGISFGSPIEKYGCTQRSITGHLGVHSTYMSRILCVHCKR